MANKFRHRMWRQRKKNLRKGEAMSFRAPSRMTRKDRVKYQDTLLRLWEREIRQAMRPTQQKELPADLR